MALTKVTKSGLADDSVDASKLEDGTIVAQATLMTVQLLTQSW